MERQSSKSLIYRSIVAALGVATLAGGYSYASRDPAVAPPVAHPAAETARAPAAPRAGLPDFADIVARQGAAVVNISVSGQVRTALPGSRGADPEEALPEFFRRFQIPGPRGGMPRHGQGSGFIIRDDGVILTNAHVVADAEEVTVKLTDKREFRAKVVGTDKLTDVAVLRIDASNLPTVKTGSSRDARVGEWVVAIGSPFGFDNSVTAGIISAKSRSLPDEGYVPFLQTDVAINPGNSGGPLFNLQGEVIGINSQIFSRSGGYQGLSFAIPIDVAMKVQQQLLEHGKVSRGRLGVTIQEVDQALADAFGLEKPAGALVSAVEKGSPADRAGLEPGDVILKFNGLALLRSNELPPLVADLAPGTPADLEIWRGRGTRSLSVKLGELAGAATAATEAGRPALGLAVRPLTEQERQEAGVAAGGLMVEQVEAGSPAARAGLRPGDRILALAGGKPATVEALRGLATDKRRVAALQLLRGEQRLFVPVPLG
jgi:serine protease Do